QSLGFTATATPWILVGASTWPGEEEILVAAWEKIRAKHPGAHLLLVPRHAERREEVQRMLEKTPWKSHFRSRGDAPAGTDILVADTTGELSRLLLIADLVFVGKSLPPQNGG